jgi:hypothetical protein
VSGQKHTTGRASLLTSFASAGADRRGRPTTRLAGMAMAAVHTGGLLVLLHRLRNRPRLLGGNQRLCTLGGAFVVHAVLLLTQEPQAAHIPDHQGAVVSYSGQVITRRTVGEGASHGAIVHAVDVGVLQHGQVAHVELLGLVEELVRLNTAAVFRTHRVYHHACVTSVQIAVTHVF